MVLDINLKDDQGIKVSQLSDYVDVRVDVPETFVVQPGNSVVVYYLNDTGVLEQCETVYHDEDPNNRYVTFKTNHFSVYVLVETVPVVEVTHEVVSVPEESIEASDEEAVEIYGEESADVSVEASTEAVDDILGEGDAARGDSAETEESVTPDESEKSEQTFENGSDLTEDDSQNLFNNSFIWIGALAAVLVLSILFLFIKKRNKQ